MALTIGTRIGPYEVGASLGAGGMGEVYRARDTKLDREVALKVLPEAFSADRERLARFEREAKTLASLNHPHIAHIHGLEDSGGIRALVMELVEGPTLADRIAQGPLPLDEALPLARQIAEALEAAHEQGIVHRDLKPANIKVRGDGTVKVLDFGLAKALAPPPEGPGSPGIANSPTFTSPAMTQAGMILGTAAYMSPEQAHGRVADKRADIWAFGVVLFEMLTGRTLFAGESTVDVLGAVLRQPLNLDRLPSDTPPAIRRVLRRCLERDAKRRLHDIADARIEIDEQINTPDREAHARVESPRFGRLAGIGLVVGIGAALLLGFWAGQWGRPSPPPRVAYQFTLPYPTPEASYPAISPDGRHIVWSTNSKLFVRALDQAAPRPLEGTDDAREPFWSPDSRSIGFFVKDQLKRIAVDGGPIEVLAAVPTGWPVGSWSTNGTIIIEVTEADAEGWYLYSRGSSALKKIKAFARDRPINPDKAYPSFLPDGEHFLFTHPLGEVATLQVGSIRSEATQPLTPADSRAVYASGHVLYVRNGTLLAHPFNPDTRTLTGDPITVIDNVSYFSPTGEAEFSISQEGTLVFRRPRGKSELRWFTRDGRSEGQVLDPNHYQWIDLSRDGQRLVAEITDPRRSTSDLWIVELARNVSTRLTSSPRSEMSPVWLPDGRSVAFSADWEGPPNLYIADGAGPPRVLVPFDRNQQYPGGATPEGGQVIYTLHVNDNSDVWIVNVAKGDRRAWLATEFQERQPKLSPNGQWLAYISDVTGRNEIYLKSFPAGDQQLRLSTEGGNHPVWRGDGRELYYYQRGTIMAVPLGVDAAGRAQPGQATRLFAVDNRAYRQFVPAPDGQRFLVNLGQLDGLDPPDEVVVDWTRLVKQ